MHFYSVSSYTLGTCLANVTRYWWRPPIGQFSRSPNLNWNTWYIKFVISSEGFVIWCCQKKQYYCDEGKEQWNIWFFRFYQMESPGFSGFILIREVNPTIVYTAQKIKFSILMMSSVNVTISAEICGFGQIYWRSP